MNNTKKCKYCQSEIDAKATICPHCRKKQGSKKPLIFVAIVALFLIIIAVSCSGGSKDTNTDTATSGNTTENTVAEQTSSETTFPQETQKQSDVSTQTNQTQTNAKQDDAVPTEYKSALKSAKNYSDIMYMSKQGIYDQLTSEYGDKFTPEAAQYAVDNLDVDWNYNALKKAESYQETMNMSPAAIHDQLTSEYGEKFTEAEANYAIENLK